MADKPKDYSSYLWGWDEKAHAWRCDLCGEVHEKKARCPQRMKDLKAVANRNNEELIEALNFLTDDFWPWFREKTYPTTAERATVARDDLATLQCERARLYIKDYKPLKKLDADDLTDMVPAEIRKRVRKSLEIFHQYTEAEILLIRRGTPWPIAE
jgi:hypothetical protein